jgi:hypothetical protein
MCYAYFKFLSTKPPLATGKKHEIDSRQANFWLEISIRTPQMQKDKHLTANLVCSIIQKFEYGENEAISRI